MSTSDTGMNLQKNVRKYIFEHFEEHATAPVLEQIMQKFGLDRTSAFNVLVELQFARHITLLPGTQRILMAFPFSSIVTSFGVRIAGKDRDYLANCAWDAVTPKTMSRTSLSRRRWNAKKNPKTARSMTLPISR